MANVLGTASAMRVGSVINELRQTRQSLDRHLNLSQEKRDLEVAFTEFYARQGIHDVSPEMIQQAIETYKQDRFTFPGWSGSGLGRAMAGFYVWFQPRTFRVSGTAAAIFLSIYLAALGFDYVGSAMQANANKAARAEIAQDIENFKGSLAKLSSQVDDNDQWVKAQLLDKTRTVSNIAANGLIADVGRSNDEMRQMRNDLADWGKLNVVVSEKAIEEDPQSTLAQFKNDVYPHIATVGGRLNTVRDSVADKRVRVERLTDIDASLQAKKAEQLPTHLPDVALKLVSVERLLAEGNDLEAKAAFDDLSKAVVRAAAVGVLNQSIQTLETRLSPTFQDDEGRKRFADLVAQAKAQASRGDQQGYRSTAQAIEKLALYVSTSLHFQFVNRNGVQTGFARTNDGTGNKRWYLVVEAVDATGSPFKMDIYNSETRVTDAVELWGQEVPQKVFEGVRDDKKSDGILDDSDLGDKPAGHYTVDYRKPVLKTQVTRWSN